MTYEVNYDWRINSMCNKTIGFQQGKHGSFSIKYQEEDTYEK